MRFAFCLFKYFPFGGLQRDFLRIARACYQHNHQIDVYTMEWQGDIPGWINLHIISCKSFSNHQRCKKFYKKLQPIFQKERYDLVIGFNKIPGLDVYYAADSCFVAREKYKKLFFLRYFPRYRIYAQYEQAIFSTSATTEILLLSLREKNFYQKQYQTPENRLHLLPPGIKRDRVAPDNADILRKQTRLALGIDENSFLLLLIGSSFKTKGVDRAIQSISDLKKMEINNIKLCVLGLRKTQVALQLIKKLQVKEKIQFIPSRENILDLLLAADVLVHPARIESAGAVLLEALVAGLPVLVTDVCGYASYIQEAESGMLIPSPFVQKNMNQLLIEMLNYVRLKQYKENALRYAQQADLFSMVDKAVELIEKIAQQRKNSFSPLQRGRC